jgi:hypothetical protein
MQELIEQAALRVVHLAIAWQNAGITEKLEIQSALFPEGLRWSPEERFFEPGNKSLFSGLQEMIHELVSNGRGEWI